MYVFPIMYQCVKTQLGEKKNMLHTCGCRGTVVKLNLAVTGQVTSGKIHDKPMFAWNVHDITWAQSYNDISSYKSSCGVTWLP